LKKAVELSGLLSLDTFGVHFAEENILSSF